MKDDLDSETSVNGVSVFRAIQLVEDVVKDWSSEYMHITRATGVSKEKIIKLTTTFSKPEKEKPVPVAVVKVYFRLDTSSMDLQYQFEHDSVCHRHGTGQSLADGKFELWLDRINKDKQEVRKYHSLTTAFEETRLAPPQTYESGADSDDEEAMEDDHGVVKLAEMGLERLRRESKATTEGLSLSDLLSNIFDAADEEDEFLLTHKEVADLIYATPLGMTAWDIGLLLTTAHENESGYIEYKPFVQAAPEIIEALLKRRAAYVSRKQPTATVTVEAIELCFGEELEEIGRITREAFNAADSNSKGELSRHDFRSCLLSRRERFSPQEIQMLMQMAKENDFGMVPYDEFVFLVQQLRIDALHNALVETDVASLRVHLILLLRREGLTSSMLMPIWTLKQVLLNADQLCLSRMQVHVVLSIVHPNEFGWVDIDYFLRVVCTVVPYMFDAATFMEKAALIAKEKADAQAKAELEELQGLTGGIGAKKSLDTEEDAVDDKSNMPDRDFVEKALIHTANIYDDKHRAQPTLEVNQFLTMMKNESVQQCQLSESEVRGLIAEAEILNPSTYGNSTDGEIPYVKHFQTWVPLIFELRKSRVYDSVLAKDWGMDAAHLVDLSTYEVAFPVLPPEMRDQSNSRRGSRSGTGGRTSRNGSQTVAEAARLSKNLNRASLRFMANRKGSKLNMGSQGRQDSKGRDREGSVFSNASQDAPSRRGSKRASGVAPDAAPTPERPAQPEE